MFRPTLQNDHGVRERAIDSLTRRCSAPSSDIRALFAQERARLEAGATVRTYLPVLTAASVRAILRRAGLIRASSDANTRDTKAARGLGTLA
jgi:hypothetical protein